MIMGRSSRKYTVFHLLMRWDDTILLDYSGIARSVAKVCKNNDGCPALAGSQTNVGTVQNAGIISFKASGE